MAGGLIPAKAIFSCIIRIEQVYRISRTGTISLQSANQSENCVTLRIAERQLITV